MATAKVMHGDLHERILKTSEEIKKSPDSAYLFFKRAKLYYQHEDYKKSLKDLDMSNELGNNSIEQELLYSGVYLKLKKFSHSMLYAQKVLHIEPRHVMAIKLMAQNYFTLGAYEKSALAYQDIIAYSTDHLPENYADASIAWEKLDNQVGYENAEEVIRKGIEDLGNLISLYNRLREIALNQKNYSKAILVQKEIIDIVPRKEFAFFKLSELHMLNNDETSALQSLAQSKSYINKLPQRTKNTSFIKELIENIKKTEVLLLQSN
jgi:tetratricopeptide (TPR) repeat protein